MALTTEHIIETLPFEYVDNVFMLGDGKNIQRNLLLRWKHSQFTDNDKSDLIDILWSTWDHVLMAQGHEAMQANEVQRDNINPEVVRIMTEAAERIGSYLGRALPPKQQPTIDREAAQAVIEQSKPKTSQSKKKKWYQLW